MKTTISFTLMFRVRNAEKAKRELRRAEELLGQNLLLSKCERYWKSTELWTCATSTAFDAPSAAEQIAGCLLCAGRLGHGWSVRGPHLRPDGSLESFEGIFDRRHHAAKIDSLEWAQFLVP